jgi:hypothetical protein
LALRTAREMDVEEKKFKIEIMLLDVAARADNP